jgi:hypothetical protein
MKEGQLGQKALDAHDLLGLPMDGFRVATPSGGLHLYFKTEKQVRNSVSRVAKNCDIRGEGGYVVGPGSTIDEKPYIVRGRYELPDLPDWMVQLATAPRTKSSVNPKSSLTDLDKPASIAAAIAWLEDEAPEAIKGMGGDATTYQVACEVRGFGISKEKCFDLMLDHWNETKALSGGPWHPEKLAVKIENAYSYATLPIGIKDAQGELGDVTAELYSLETKQHTPPNRLHYVGFKASAAQALEAFGQPLVKGLLDCGAFSVLYADTNQGKTFVMLDIAFHIAAGRPWNGRKVKQGLVVYVAAEGGRGIFKRLAALREHHAADDVPLVVVPCPINLLDKSKAGDTRELIKLVRQAEKDYGMQAELVVIDTLSRALAGGNEHGPEDMGTFVSHMDKIREATKTHLCVVHHTGHGNAKRMRGWSGVPAALDTTLEISDGVLRNTKQRDREQAKPITFKLKPIRIGVDEDGDPVTSAVVVWGKEMEDVSAEIPLSEQEEAMLDALVALASEKASEKATKGDKPEPAEVAIKTNEILKSVGKHDPTLRLSDSTLKGICRSLSDKKAIRKGEYGQWVIPSVGKCRKVSETTV